MADWTNRLGPQGSRLLQQSQNFNQINNINNYITSNIQIPTELDYVLHHIVNALPNSGNSDKIISYLAYYYPKIKNASNVELLTLKFLQCPLFFSSIDLLSIETMSKLIELFQYIILTKFKITNPSLPFYEFYTSLYNAIRHAISADSTAYWKVIPLLSGCISSISYMNRYNNHPQYSHTISKLNKLYIQAYSNSLQAVYNIHLMSTLQTPFTLSLVYVHEYMDDLFYAEVCTANVSIMEEITNILFISNTGLKKGSLLYSDLSYDDILKSNPVLRYLNRWVFVYSRLLENNRCSVRSVHTLLTSVNNIFTFSSNISNNNLESLQLKPDKWNLIKYIFFSVVMIFESNSKFIISGVCPLSEPIFVIASQMQHTLFNLSYVLDQIGAGGFDSYNFLFDSTSYLLCEKSPEMLQKLLYSLLNEIPPTMNKFSDVETSKLDYFLKLVEKSLPYLKQDFKNTTLSPMLATIFTSESSKISTIELSHSIMINFLDKLIDSNHTSKEMENIVYPYFEKVISHFPKHISFNQTSFIITKCGHASVSKPQFIFTLMDLINFHISMSAYTPLPERRSFVNGNEVIIPEKLFTRRAGLVGLSFDVLQFIPVDNFIRMLDNCKRNIDSLMGDRDIYTLYDLLWDKILSINRFDSQRGQAGIDWWYDNVNNGIVPKL